MRTAVTLSTFAAAAVLAGCSTLSSLNPFSSKAEKNPPAPLVDFKPSLTVKTAWTVSVGAARGSVFAPALANDSVFAAASDGTIVRVDAATGRQMWKANAGMPLTAGVGTDGLLVAVAGEKGTLIAFDADGKQRWKVQASSEVLASPAVGQGLVIVRTVDNRISAYDAETGNRRWVMQRTAPPLTLRAASGIAISGPTAYVGMPGGRLLALAVSNGGPRWEVPIGDPKGTTELERIADVAGTPVVAGRDACAVAYQGRVACVDAVTGAPRWAKDFSSDVGVAVDEHNLYAADDHGAVNAFVRETGTGVWRNNKLANRRLSTPAAVNRAVAVGDSQGYVHFLSREDGAFVARIATDGSSLTAAVPVMNGRNVIFQTQAGTLVALAAE
jgi:outer membrane protein assembly factor BamB